MFSLGTLLSDIEGDVFNLCWYMRNQGYSPATIDITRKVLRRMLRMVPLQRPEAVRAYIANHPGCQGYKKVMCDVYNRYARFQGVTWKKPVYKQKETLPYIPTEKQIDVIIARASRRYKLVFRLLKECGFRPIELHWLTMRSIDLERGIIRVTSAKYGKPRAVKLKASTLAMLKEYVGKANVGVDEKLFPNPTAMTQTWIKIKNRLAEELHQPDLKKIRLYDLRHFYATMLYHKTKDILYVQRQLGHRNLKTTLIYTHLIAFGDDEWHSAVASTVKEACKLVEQGFEYVCDVDGSKVFRKRK